MTTHAWQPVHGFGNIEDYDHFVTWIESEIEQRHATEIDVTSRFLGFTTFTERWFLQRPSQTRWRLIEPDGPFRGLFDRVT